MNAREQILIIWKKFTINPLNMAQDFFESGGDSLGAINMIVEIQKQFNVDISLEKFMRNPTINFLFDITHAEMV